MIVPLCVTYTSCPSRKPSGAASRHVVHDDGSRSRVEYGEALGLGGGVGQGERDVPASRHSHRPTLSDAHRRRVLESDHRGAPARHGHRLHSLEAAHDDRVVAEPRQTIRDRDGQRLHVGHLSAVDRGLSELVSLGEREPAPVGRKGEVAPGDRGVVDVGERPCRQLAGAPDEGAKAAGALTRVGHHVALRRHGDGRARERIIDTFAGREIENRANDRRLTLR